MIDSSQPHRTDFISEAEAQTLAGLFGMRVRRSPDRIAYQQYDANDQSWHAFSWKEIHLLVSRWHEALEQEKLLPGDRVAIMLKNSIEWVCFDQAAQSFGLILVSVYPSDTAEDVSYILADAGVSLLLLRDHQQWQYLSGHCVDVTSLKRVWCLFKDSEMPDDMPGSQDAILRYIDDILPHEASPHLNKLPEPNEVATIIYTSGTTGRPKGVMLTHHNLLSNAQAVQKIIPALTDDVFLSFLPLAHSFERTVEYYLPMMAGSCVSYARSIKLLAEDLLTIRPSAFLSAPRLYEKIYSVIHKKIAHRYLKRKLLDWTISLGWLQFEASQQRRPPLNPLQKLVWRWLHHLVAKKVLSRLGGRVRIAVTGAAPLPAKVGHFFLGLNLPLLEGYGLTEAGPVVSGNLPDKNVPGSVGEALPGVEVATSDIGELLVRSPGVMRGYWQQDDATHRAIDNEGWLHTGDLAEIRGGTIYIRGRLKEIIVTSTGEKVAPADVEMTIMLDPLFEQAMVVGEGKPCLAALLVLNPEAWASFATGLNLDPADQQSLRSPTAMQAVLDKLADLLDAFPGYAQIHAVHLSCEPWSIENGLLTPTLKIKRNVLERQFAREITTLYRGHLMVD